MLFMTFAQDMIIILALLVVSFLSQYLVSKHYNMYLKQPNSTGMTGKEAAEAFLQSNGIYDVSVVPQRGFLNDFYDPTHKVIRLSEANYYGRSVSSVAVACHEVGHAIQHAKGYKMLVLRNKLVPITNIASNLSWFLLFFGIFMGSFGLIYAGIGLFAVVGIFQLVTLPVEINASHRAMNYFNAGNCLSIEETDGAKKVLTAAAFTYIAALLSTVLQLLRYVLIFGNRDE